MLLYAFNINKLFLMLYKFPCFIIFSVVLQQIVSYVHCISFHALLFSE